MKVSALLSTALVLSSSSLLSGQQKSQPVSAAKVDFQAVGAPLKADPVDTQIKAALKLVSADRIKSNITRLVEFRNRSTISSWPPYAAACSALP